MRKPMIAVAAASASFVMLILWSFSAPPSMLLLGWSMMSAVAACFAGGWHLIEHERARVEHIARLAAQMAVEQAGLESVT